MALLFAGGVHSVSQQRYLKFNQGHCTLTAEGARWRWVLVACILKDEPDLMIESLVGQEIESFKCLFHRPGSCEFIIDTLCFTVIKKISLRSHPRRVHVKSTFKKNYVAFAVRLWLTTDSDLIGSRTQFLITVPAALVVRNAFHLMLIK